ncbi:unnamed protein product [Didymodactylos carnosus]|uniref:F-box domain-containing protein n=1 Tax=Didymodactylos carnosus TaxID=1234261 RepID=A0A813Y7Z2_9BILA|nr:unnamed protein product [Didymodactylos carnosus]CAF0942521.1 unnamed protein product [Didymodactylos carnosus]CAF3666300.1 unnamed protein product [Didymodactylos carnosus]CAF3717465.1 unnamed protein product [Didymodactylos carnosus]
MAESVLSFFELPLLTQEKILKYLPYSELSRIRIVSKRMHHLCSGILNRSYYLLEPFIQELQRSIKSKLPRRESERHKHPLSYKFDTISSLDSRIQWLKLTFNSAIGNGLCCFYPGKLLDEIYIVIRHLQLQQICPNPRSILQEVRDMSSMAIEHFREHIEPKLQQTKLMPLTNSLGVNSSFSLFSTPTSTSVSSLRHQLAPQLRKHHTMLKSSNALLREQINVLRKSVQQQNMLICSKNYQLGLCRRLLQYRTRSVLKQSYRIKRLEKNLVQTNHILNETRQKFDQFLVLYNSNRDNSNSREDNDTTANNNDNNDNEQEKNSITLKHKNDDDDNDDKTDEIIYCSTDEQEERRNCFTMTKNNRKRQKL